MCVFKNGKFYHYEFTLDGRRHRGSTGTADRDEAVKEESRQRERLERSYSQVIEEEGRKQRRKAVASLRVDLARHDLSFGRVAVGHGAGGRARGGRRAS